MDEKIAFIVFERFAFSEARFLMVSIDFLLKIAKKNVVCFRLVLQISKWDHEGVTNVKIIYKQNGMITFEIQLMDGKIPFKMIQ